MRKHEGSQPVGTLDCEVYIRLRLSYDSQLWRTLASLVLLDSTRLTTLYLSTGMTRTVHDDSNVITGMYSTVLYVLYVVVGSQRAHTATRGGGSPTVLTGILRT